MGADDPQATHIERLNGEGRPLRHYGRSPFDRRDPRVRPTPVSWSAPHGVMWLGEVVDANLDRD